MDLIANWTGTNASLGSLTPPAMERWQQLAQQRLERFLQEHDSSQ